MDVVFPNSRGNKAAAVNLRLWNRPGTLKANKRYYGIAQSISPVRNISQSVRDRATGANGLPESARGSCESRDDREMRPSSQQTDLVGYKNK